MSTALLEVVTLKTYKYKYESEFFPGEFLPLKVSMFNSVGNMLWPLISNILEYHCSVTGHRFTTI